MYWSGWEMGAVEAISLSILVGSSVDYCVHLVEGYLLAGENLPLHQAEVSSVLPTALHSFFLCPPMPLNCDAGHTIGKGGCVLAPSEHPWGMVVAACPADCSDYELVYLSTVNSDGGPTHMVVPFLLATAVPEEHLFTFK